MLEKLVHVALLLAVLAALAVLGIGLYAVFYGPVAEGMSGYREMQPQCKSTDWLCKAMVQYCQAIISDPCSQTNIDQPWHPENPQRWLNSIHDPVVAPQQPNVPTP